jgi:hypothetical protein
MCVRHDRGSAPCKFSQWHRGRRKVEIRVRAFYGKQIFTGYVIEVKGYADVGGNTAMTTTERKPALKL